MLSGWGERSACPSSLAVILLWMIWRHISCWEDSFPIADLAVPPVLVGAVCDGDDIAASKVQFAGFLWHKIVQRLHEHLQHRNRGERESVRIIFIPSWHHHGLFIVCMGCVGSMTSMCCAFKINLPVYAAHPPLQVSYHAIWHPATVTRSPSCDIRPVRWGSWTWPPRGRILLGRRAEPWNAEHHRGICHAIQQRSKVSEWMDDGRKE